MRPLRFALAELDFARTKPTDCNPSASFAVVNLLRSSIYSVSVCVYKPVQNELYKFISTQMCVRVGAGV